MSVRYLVDAGIALEPLRRDASAAVMRRLRRHEDDIALAAPTWAQLDRAWRRMPASWERDVVRRYLEDVVLRSFPVLEYDAAAASRHAIGGGAAESIAAQVAAIALARDLIVATARPDRYAGIDGLAIDDWR